MLAAGVEPGMGTVKQMSPAVCFYFVLFFALLRSSCLQHPLRWFSAARYREDALLSKYNLNIGTGLSYCLSADQRQRFGCSCPFS